MSRRSLLSWCTLGSARTSGSTVSIASVAAHFFLHPQIKCRSLRLNVSIASVAAHFFLPGTSRSIFTGFELVSIASVAAHFFLL